MSNTEFPGHGGKFNLSCQPCEYNSLYEYNFIPTLLPRGLEKSILELLFFEIVQNEI